MSGQFHPTACPHDCPSTCALEVEKLDDYTIGKVRGAKDNDYTSGVICAKVSKYAERIHHPDRLSQPLKRVGAKGEGRFEPIGWDEALDRVAEAFKKAADDFGAEAVWPYQYAGTMGLVQRQSIQRLRHVMGYSNQGETICSSVGRVAWPAGNGALRGSDPRDMAMSNLIVIWGGNPVSTQINVMTHVAKARKNNGAQLVVVDPYRSPTAEAADIHIAPKPGTDGALAVAMMHVLLEEGLADTQYMARYSDDPARLRHHLKDKTPAWAAAITGIDENIIRDFARLYGATKKSFLRVGYGFTRMQNGATNMHAVSCLPVVTGAYSVRGGGALYSNGALYSDVKVDFIAAADRKDKSVRTIDMCRIGDALLGDPSALRGGGPVKAMLVQNTNPAVVAPETGKVLEGLKREDLFLCVHEQFMTDTAKYADIVLPATMFMEHADMYRGGGHVYFQVTKPVIKPYADCRSNHDVINQLARRLGADHPAFELSDWDIMDKTLQDAGFPDADYCYHQRWIDCSRGWESSNYRFGFDHKDDRFHFVADWKAVADTFGVEADGVDDMPSLPDHWDVINKTDEDHPFRLMTSPARTFLNSSFNNTPHSRGREGRPTALLHPTDMDALGLSEGDVVRVGNAQASVLLHVKAGGDTQQTGVVVCESLWSNDDYIEGLGINALVSSRPVAPAGGAAFHDTAVWIKPDR